MTDRAREYLATAADLLNRVATGPKKIIHVACTGCHRNVPPDKWDDHRMLHAIGDAAYEASIDEAVVAGDALAFADKFVELLGKARYRVHPIYLSNEGLRPLGSPPATEHV